LQFVKLNDVNTGSVWAVTKLVLRTIVVYYGCYLLFERYGHFSPRQSILLAIVAGTVLDFSLPPLKNPPKFAPFYMQVEPQWHSILIDQGFVDEQGWKALQERCTSLAADRSEYRLLFDGIRFSVLGPGLCYSNNHHSFGTEIDFGGSIPELLPEGTTEGFGSFAPRFYVKEVFKFRKKLEPNFAGLEFGLITQESIKKGAYPGDDRSHITLALLPKETYAFYYGVERAEAGDKRITELLEKNGWKEKERDGDDRLLNWPLELNHKYFRVQHNSI
jgi:hypothetical protein